jgi:hypothetical protein
LYCRLKGSLLARWAFVSTNYLVHKTTLKMLKINRTNIFREDVLSWRKSCRYTGTGRQDSNLRLPPSCEASCTTTTTIICIYFSVFILLILYYIECKSFFRSKWIQIKNLSTAKFHNFLRSTTFNLEVSPFEVVYKIWISNLGDSSLVFRWQYDFE